MTNGLISTFEGRLILLLIWAALALLAALACTVAVMLRKAPPLTTQVDQRTGVKEHGIGWWLITFLALFLGPVLLMFLVVVGLEIMALTPVWVWPIGGAVGLLAVVVAIFVRARQRATEFDTFPEPVNYPPQPLHVEAPQTVGWSLPDGVEQWDERNVSAAE